MPFLVGRGTFWNLAVKVILPMIGGPGTGSLRICRQGLMRIDNDQH
jgi:hypothetical protein